MTPPVVKFFSNRSELFVQDGRRWRRMSSADEAKARTGCDLTTNELNLGVGISQRPNGLLNVEFDLWRLGVDLRPETVERLRARWEREVLGFSKPLQKSVNKRVHFSKSFAVFEIAPAQLEEWKRELAAVLENPESFEATENRNVIEA
jgi:hypothetical protein